MERLLVIILVIVAFEYFLSSCASIASPSGGPKDTIAPQLDTSFPPNFSINFKSREIKLIFNEYLTLKNANQQIILSPPVDEKLETKIRGKHVRIGLPDILLNNTTYTLSFGNSIIDFREGNVNDELKYIFSTGNFIDSLSLSGSVTDAFTNVAKEMLVALYEIKESDSIKVDSLPYKCIPTYYSYTDESGYFNLEYLKYGTFLLLAFEDKRGNFKLNTGNEIMAFYPELIELKDSLNPFKIKSFRPQKKRQFYGARLEEKGKIQLSFSRPVPDIKVERIFPLEKVKQDDIFLDFWENKDTIFYWFEDNDLDSIKLRITGYDNIDDTILIRALDRDIPKLKLNVNDAEIKEREKIRISSNLPLTSIDLSKIYFYDSKDTIPFSLDFDQKPTKEFFIVPLRYPTDINLSLKEGTVSGFFASKSDSLTTSLKVLKGEDLGSLKFSITTGHSINYILIITDPTGKEIVKKSFSGSTTINIKKGRPGKYKAYAIEDINGDGKWTPGDFTFKRLPENVIYYREKLEIKANWDIELEWKIKSS